jgi:RimJ/RimL family protein N-acetyltransferase
VQLRPVWPADYEFLFGLAHHEGLSHRWRLRNHTPSLDSFVAGTLYAGTHVQFMIESREPEQPIGHLAAYNADLRNGTAYVAQVLHPDLVGGRYGFEAFLLFANYLLVSWPLRKLYAETTDLSIGTFASGEGSLYEIEGVLKDHELYDGRYWDGYILTFTAERLAAQLDRWMPRLVGAGHASRSIYRGDRVDSHRSPDHLDRSSAG